MSVNNSKVEVRDSSSDQNACQPTWEEESKRSMSFMELSDVSKLILLRGNGYLFGIRVDDNTTPRRSAIPVAHRKLKSLVHVRDLHEIDTEIIIAQNERESNYVHKGWSLAAISAISPWTSARIANTNQANRTVRSVTKRIVVQQLRVDMLLDDLVPVPELVAEVRAALGKSNRSQKFQSLYRVFERWGDVIPLVFDLGTLLAVTDSESNVEMCSNEATYFGIGQWGALKTAKISTLGGDPITLQSGVRNWLQQPVPVGKWAQVRIIKAAPITALLDKGLQAQLLQLYNSMITSLPLNFDYMEFDSELQVFDDSPHVLKTISAVTVCFGFSIKALSVGYLDGTCSDEHGENGGARHTFKLNPDEHISEVIVWTEEGICGLQFLTNMGRISQHYGSPGGTPDVLRSAGGYLAGFKGVIRDGCLEEIGAIWRHDIEPMVVTKERKFSKYYGGYGGGVSFNDWSFLEPSDSARISSIKVRCGATEVNGIQFTFTDQKEGHTIESQAQNHGSSVGTEKTFSLEPGEHIITVSGKHSFSAITQLCFVTNLGRTSDVFGGGEGTQFLCQAPQTDEGKPMRLHYTYGTCNWSRLAGILFVWAPL